MLKKRRKKALEEGHTNNIWNRHDFVMCGLGEKSRTLAIVKHIRRCIKWSSQLDALDDTLRRKFWDIRNIILPGLRKYSLNGSYGIFSPDRNAKAAIAYDMQQEFRYRRAWFLKPEGGYTVDFGRPLPCEDDPCDFPKAECYDMNGEFRIRVYIDDTQLGVIIDALNIGILEYDCQIRKLFDQGT